MKLVRFAEMKPPYHRHQHNAVPELYLDLAQLPLVDHNPFRAAYSEMPPENGVLISSSSVDDTVFKTGGTTAVTET